MTKILAGHYQLEDPRLTGEEQQELENQLSDAARELNIPFELVKKYYSQAFQEQPLSDESFEENSEVDEFCLGVHLPSWHAGYRKCLEVIQERLNG